MFVGVLAEAIERYNCEREAIYDDDVDREVFVGVLAEAIERYNWVCHGFCLMTNLIIC